MILLFIISKVILFFVSSLADLITKLPIIHQFNELGGVLYGIIIGFFIVYVILFIISFISAINPDISNFIENTYITKLMYNNNILKVFFK